MKLIPIDKEGYGRIIRTVLLDRKKTTDLITSINNPKIVKKNNSIINLENTEITSQNKKKLKKHITVIYIDTISFGLVVLVAKEVIRTVRPHDIKMDLETFLEDWPYTIKDDFVKKNCIFIENGKLLQQFRYIVPNSLPWSDIHPQQTPDGKYIAEVSFVSESLNAQILSSLFTTQRCIHFLTYYQSIHKDQWSYILVQHCDASLATESKKCRQSDVEVYIIQVLVALRKMQTEFKMVHNDLFLYSIVIQRVQKYMKWKKRALIGAKAWKYRYKNGWIYVKPTPSIVKISDLGFSSSFITPGGVIRNDIWQGEKCDIGMSNMYTPQCDIMTFLNDLRVNFKCKFANHCLEFISTQFGYVNMDDMLEKVLIPGQDFRIQIHTLDGLDAAWLLDRLELIFERYKPKNVSFDPPCHEIRILAMEE